MIDTFERASRALPSDGAFADLEIIEQRSRRFGSAFELTLSLDRRGAPVDVATCERVAARLNRALDAFTEPYTLLVQSAGVDRPLYRAADYERFRGERVRVRTRTLLDGRKTHRGTLRDVHDATVVLEVAGNELRIPCESIESANVECDVRADLRRAKKERKDARKSR